MRVMRKGRVVDVVLVVALVTLGFWSMVANVVGPDVPVEDARHALSTHSWLMVPLWMAACAAPLWWRRGALEMCLATCAIVAVHDVAFGYVVRCGSGLPLAFAIAFLVGYGEPRRRAWLGLLASLALQVLVLLVDAAAPLMVLPATALIGVVVWGTGYLARQRAEMTSQLRARTNELRQLRDQSAQLAVSGDRARLSAELDSLLDNRLDQLMRVAEQGAAEPTKEVLAQIEESSRATLDEMRTIVGVLRGTDVALSPAPTVSHIDGLLARLSSTRVTVRGDARSLPASVELSAYRIVEHLLGALEVDPDLSVALVFGDAVLEVNVSGRAARTGDLKSALARARERARVQEGRLEATVKNGRARVVAQLPVTA